jgi:hypothetical protein
MARTGRSNGAASDGRRWPNLFIVGAAKARTTWLWHQLGAHPDVYMPPAKEQDFFWQAEKIAFMKVHDEDEYVRRVNRANGERYLGEASPAYLWGPSTPGAIRSRVADARILITLRALFAPDGERLEELLGRPLLWHSTLARCSSGADLCR